MFQPKFFCLHFLRRVALLLCWTVAAGASVADPAPVTSGLWEVNLMTSFAPVPTSPAQAAPRKPLRRIYRICIGPNRARAPMHAPSKASRVELIFDRNNISGSYFQTGADGQLRPVEFLYRRLAAGRFEGSQDVTEADWISRTQYMAQRVAADCGPLQPQPMSESGEP